MGLHLAAFSASQVTATVNGPLTLVQDSFISSDPTGNALLPMGMKLQQAYGFGTGFIRARALAPSLKTVGYPRIPRFDRATVPPDLPGLVNFGDNPPFIQMTETFTFQTNNNDAATQRETVLAWLTDRTEPVPPGQSYTLFGQATITGLAVGWASGVITWEDVYPTKKFAVIGLRVTGTNCCAGRLIPPYGGMRPGTVGMATEDIDDWGTVWNGSFGSLMTFVPPVFPQLEVFTITSGSQVFNIYLQVVPLN